VQESHCTKDADWNLIRFLEPQKVSDRTPAAPDADRRWTDYVTLCFGFPLSDTNTVQVQLDGYVSKAEKGTIRIDQPGLVTAVFTMPKGSVPPTQQFCNLIKADVAAVHGK